ncbi:MAG: hypothetical protein M1840_000506 [Geoglossum simile]|nr:MAG: hypothetical protein M1840_000506 [Geoglossum simile]
MSKGDLYTCSEQDLIDAAAFYQRAKHLAVELGGHLAAVQIIITPSPHPALPRQTVFSPHCQYEICCQGVILGPTDGRIRQAFQNVVGAYFRIFLWDFSDENCYTRNPTLLPRCPRGHPEVPRVLSKPADELEDQDKEVTRQLVQKIQEGLGCDPQRLDFNGQHYFLSPFQSHANSFRHSYQYQMMQLSQIADKFDAVSWYVKLLAGSLYLASLKFPFQEGSQLCSNPTLSRSRVRDLESIAILTNGIVNGLWDTWGREAFLVYHALAVNNRQLPGFSRFGRSCLLTIVQYTVEQLKAKVTTPLNWNRSLFDLPWTLSVFAGFDYRTISDTLGLPLL